LFRTHRVSLDDLGVQQGLQPAHGSAPKDGASWASTQPACSAVRRRVAAAIRLAW
jgi:hypothetical protein